MSKFEKFEDGESSRSNFILEKLETANTIEEMQKALAELMHYLAEELEIELQPDVSKLYEEMQNERLLARLENLRRIVEAIEKKTPFKIGDENDHYANAVLPENEGLKIAFAEGNAPGPVRLLIGFDTRSLISFNPQGLEVHEIDIKESDPRDPVKRLLLCRHVVGTLYPHQIKHLILRIPRSIFPENMLAEEDSRYKNFIFRGARLKHETAPENPEDTTTAGES
jgi:hypothetical protein